MKQSLSIKLKLADRDYPMQTDSDTESRLRMAAKMINEKVKAYRKEFGIDNRQDLLAMVALDYAVESLTLNEESEDMDSLVTKKIDFWSSLIDSTLNSD
ncbi:cell division protein ZapA [uncultured Microscilla sp.]|uniref:cell division protein ZapA n=1 Tax=uncultured Microscilla sp. TaxID=432653 RepID=UPI00262F8DC6|nr:cell division protein ZapA [uncultured Microscilla sp.]